MSVSNPIAPKQSTDLECAAGLRHDSLSEKDLSIVHCEEVTSTGRSEYVVDTEAERRSVPYGSTLRNHTQLSARATSRLVRRIDLRLITGSTLMYMLAFVDRFNIVGLS